MPRKNSKTSTARSRSTSKSAGRGPAKPAKASLAHGSEKFLKEVLAGIRASLNVINIDFKVLNRPGGGRKAASPGEYDEFLSFSEPCPFCPAEKVFETGKPERVVTPVATKGKDGKYYEIHAFPLKGTDGKVERVIELIRDVTEERRLQERYRASEQLAVVGRLAAGIAHEIKNPLGIILSSSQILTNPLRPGAQRAEAAEMLNDEVERLSNIVNDFLRYARPGPLNRRPSSLNELIHETVSIWSAGRGEQGRWNLREELDPSDPIISIDPDQMRQVVLNLLINAYQATGEGGSLTIRTKALDGGGMELAFLDDGPGVAQEILDHIFEPFFTTKEQGTGLGLSIVKRIVDAHGGEIYVDNRRPKGAICRVSLPGDLESPPPAGAHRGRRSAPASRKE